jgi:hypothetical protein
MVCYERYLYLHFWADGGTTYFNGKGYGEKGVLPKWKGVARTYVAQFTIYTLRNFDYFNPLYLGEDYFWGFNPVGCFNIFLINL